MSKSTKRSQGKSITVSVDAQSARTLAQASTRLGQLATALEKTVAVETDARSARNLSKASARLGQLATAVEKSVTVVASR